jgi:hypothetical protein
MTGYDNCVVINFPIGAKGHIAGRLLATCNNVAWYNYKTNGKNPWNAYNDPNDNFTLFHFTRRFYGAVGKGVCSNTIPPVLEIADRLNLSYNNSSIVKWKKDLYPLHFVYPINDKLSSAKEFFGPAKHLVIIPDNIDNLVDRVIKTSFHYFINPKDKTKTFKDKYENMSKKTNQTVKECIEQDLLKMIDEFNTNRTAADTCVSDVDNLLDLDYFLTVIKNLNLEFNRNDYLKTVKFIKDNIG